MEVEFIAGLTPSKTVILSEGLNGGRANLPAGRESPPNEMLQPGKENQEAMKWRICLEANRVTYTLIWPVSEMSGLPKA